MWSEQLLKSLHSEIIHWRCYAILLILLGSAELFFPGVKWFDGSFSFLFCDGENFVPVIFSKKTPPNSYKVSTMYLPRLHNTNYNQVILVACISSILLDNIFVINRLQKKNLGVTRQLTNDVHVYTYILRFTWFFLLEINPPLYLYLIHPFHTRL